MVWGCSIDAQNNVVGGSTYKKEGETQIPLDGSFGDGSFAYIEFRTGPVEVPWAWYRVNTHVSVSLLQKTDDYFWISARVDSSD